MTISEKDKGLVGRLKVLMGAEKPYPWASRIGITQATFNRMWKEGISPKAETLVHISQATGCSIDWLLTGEGEMMRGAPKVPDQMREAGELYKVPHHGAEFILVPRYEVGASAGGGAVVHSEQIVDYLSFKAEWVQHVMGLSEKQLALINVKGDSMESTLSNGDLILVDLRTHQVEDNSIYVLQLNGVLLVKRIQRKLDGSVVVISDNKVYEPEVVSGDMLGSLNIIGRVVWCGRRM